MKEVRVRFAPSPTGPLHIGGVRTALYNYLFAKKNKGKFLLRIEDTDQQRYVDGAEEYIKNSLRWVGLNFDEGPEEGGKFGPYRQSERKALYNEYAMKLIDSGHAYYAFDTAEELEKMRESEMQKGVAAPKYDFTVRHLMKNSLVMSSDEVTDLLHQNIPYVVRLKVPEGRTIKFNDLVRGEVSFDTNELDDKVILKGDGMPTYHLANIVDDYLMKISHVIRGEEWLSSTAHHVLLYEFMGWGEDMPRFTHLPLILKPTGKGKLSKRDGANFGFPVFPLNWMDKEENELYLGFKEFGFLPEATINFLALLGWNPGTEQEIFSMDELIQEFAIEKIVKSGAKFNIEKAKWFNQQYILQKSDVELSNLVRPFIENEGFKIDDDFLLKVCHLMKPRLEVLTDIITKSKFFFNSGLEYDEKTVLKKWKDDNITDNKKLRYELEKLDSFKSENLDKLLHDFIAENQLNAGNIYHILRIAITGTLNGPELTETMEILGKNEILSRLDVAFRYFDSIYEKSGLQ